jgi:hypothetical protein
MGLVDRLGGLMDAQAALREALGLPADAVFDFVHVGRPSFVKMVRARLDPSASLRALISPEFDLAVQPGERQLLWFRMPFDLDFD